MSTELKYLALTAMLTASLWIPVYRRAGDDQRVLAT